MTEPTQNPVHGARLLLVDDVPANLGALGEVLASAGAKIFIAQSGPAALARLATVRPDLILLDVTMPGMDGFEVCRRLKAEAQWSDIPVLFVSALSDMIDKVAGFTAGGVDYILKPFHAEEVLARVAAHLSIRSLQRSLAEQALALHQKNSELEREMQRRLATELAMRRSLDQAVLVGTRTGDIRFCSDRASVLLQKFFPASAPGCVPAALLAGRETTGLRVRRSMREDLDEILWLLEPAPVAPSPAQLERLGLTPREAEILSWVAYGKTNAEIAVMRGTPELLHL